MECMQPCATLTYHRDNAAASCAATSCAYVCACLQRPNSQQIARIAARSPRSIVRTQVVLHLCPGELYSLKTAARSVARSHRTHLPRREDREVMSAYLKNHAQSANRPGHTGELTCGFSGRSGRDPSSSRPSLRSRRPMLSKMGT
jgi:hypothetical protein